MHTLGDRSVDIRNIVMALLVVDCKYHKVYHEIQLVAHSTFLCVLSILRNLYGIFLLILPPKFNNININKITNTVKMKFF